MVTDWTVISITCFHCTPADLNHHISIPNKLPATNSAPVPFLRFDITTCDCKPREETDNLLECLAGQPGKHQLTNSQIASGFLGKNLLTHLQCSGTVDLDYQKIF